MTYSKICIVLIISATNLQLNSMNKKTEPIESKDELIKAILHEDIPMIKWALLNKNPNYFNEEIKFTPLSLACVAGKMQIVKLLLDAGAGTDFQVYDVNKRPKNSTALTEAARHGHYEVAKKLISVGANVNPQNPDNFTPLHAAARIGNIDIIHMLIGFEANINAQTYFERITPLHESIPDLTQAKRDKELERKKYHIALLLLQAGANPNLRTICQIHNSQPMIVQDKTALTLAAFRHKILHVLLLRLMGADCYKQDRYGVTANDYLNADSYLYSME